VSEDDDDDDDEEEEEEKYRFVLRTIHIFLSIVIFYVYSRETPFSFERRMRFRNMIWMRL
jgi:hypothetical protein